MTPEQEAIALAAPVDCPRLTKDLPRGALCSRCDQNREAHAIRDILSACGAYLKDGETPAERIERERSDTMAVMTLLAKEKQKNEALRAQVEAHEPQPGVVHPIDAAFYKVAIAERDAAWREIGQLRAIVTALRVIVEAGQKLVEQWRAERPKNAFGIGKLIWDMSTKRADELAATLPPQEVK